MDSLYEDDYYYTDDYDYYDDYDWDYMVKFMTRRSTQLKKMRQASPAPKKGKQQRMMRQRKLRNPAKSVRGHAQALAGAKPAQKKMAAKKAPKTMAYVDVWIDKDEASDIVQPVIDGQIEADNMAQDMYWEWAWQWEEWATLQEQREEEAFYEMVDLLFDSVYVDGWTLRDWYGDPSYYVGPQVYKKCAKGACKGCDSKTMTKKILQEIYYCDEYDYCYYTEYVDDYTDPEYIEFTFEFPSGEDLDAVIADLADKSQQIKDAVEKSINEIYPQVKDIQDQREDALEDLAENELYDMAESVRDVVGGIADSVETYDDYWEDDWTDGDWDYDYDYDYDSTTNSTDTSSDWYYDSYYGDSWAYDETTGLYEYTYYDYYYE